MNGQFAVPCFFPAPYETALGGVAA